MLSNILFILNSLVLLTNIRYLVFNKKNEIKNNNNFNRGKIFNCKNSDNSFINIIKNKFEDISNYLNNKYNVVNSKILIDKKGYFNEKNKPRNIINYFLPKTRKKIILYSVDLFSFKSHKRWLKNKLKDKFDIKFKRNKPDYLLYNVFGSNHLNPKYNNSIKIAIFTENFFPDFNEADYIIGHYHINYLDRYFKNSIFLTRNINNNYFYFYRNKVLNNPKRIKFCAAVISNYQITDGFRNHFINELNKYKKIDMGGKYNNTISRSVDNKIEFLSSYKFSISMENSNGDGYLSEKIVDSLIAGTIPIYYGDYMVDEYINPKTYILIKGEKDIFDKIEYIKKIDNDDNLYKSILKEKVLLEDNIKNIHNKELKQFLYNIFSQNKTKAYRK